MLFYTAQVWLCRQINEVRRQMSGSDCLNQPLSQVQVMLAGHEAALSAWRSLLPPALAWQDDDPPPSDILAVKLRAKYWTAWYLIKRPFLDFALHIMPVIVRGGTVESVSRNWNRNQRDEAEIHLYAIQRLSEGEVRRASQQCVYAAVQSTVASDTLPGRLIAADTHVAANV